MKVRTILAPTDLSAQSMAGIRVAQNVARKFRASVVVLTVDDRDLPAGAISALEIHGRNPDRERIREMLKFLRRTLRDYGLDPSKFLLVVRKGSPARAIVDAAVERGVEMIVMSTHGRTGLSHVLVGSVAEQVVRLARCPVLTVKPSEILADT